MKKILLSTAAVGLAFAAMPAHAAIDLEVGGYFKGYGAFVDQDETNGVVNDFDFLKDTELHISGETTLDNGLTVGAHLEFDVDDADGNAGIDESYAYFSGTWGRVNFGEEDGAAYLLQIAAPSADKNVDGLRTYINGVNAGVLTSQATLIANAGQNIELQYDQATTGKATKLTYLTPVVSGFQAGLTYVPDTQDTAGTNDGFADGEEGIGTDDVAGAIGETYEVAGRYEGQFEGVGIALGAGYSHGDLEATAAGSDDREAWNVGADLDFGPFGLGVVYKEDNGASNAATSDDEEIFVVGVDYTTGPFKLGASYYNVDNFRADKDLDAERYTGGVVYTYGPGMTLRGSVSYVEFEEANIGGAGKNDVDATSFLIGTQVKF